MKVKLLIAALIIFSAFLPLDAELKISPEKAIVNQKVKLSYTLPQNFKSEGKLFAYIYAFSNDDALPNAYRVQLHKISSEGYEAEFQTSNDDIFSIVKIGDGFTFDNNNNDFWDFIVYDSLGKALFGAEQKRALSYLGNFPLNCSRNISFEKALKYLERELNLHPSNTVAEIGLASTELDLRKISKDDFDSTIRSIYNKTNEYNDENLVIAMSNALKAAGQTKQAEDMETLFIQRHPFSKMAEDKQMNELKNAASFNDFEKKVFQFLERFPNSNHKEKVWLALMKAYKNADRLTDFINLIKDKDKIPPEIYTQLAVELSSGKRSTDTKADGEVMFYFNKAIECVKYNINYPKPKFYTDDEWENAKAPKLANINILIADAQEADGRISDGIESMLKAKALLGDECKYDFYDSMTDLYLKDGKGENAYLTSQEAILNSESSTFTDSVFKENYFKFTKSQKGYEIFLDSLTDAAKSMRLKKLSSVILSQKVELPTLLTSNGEDVDMTQFKGKILVLAFWSTWCEPCKQSFPAMVKLKELYSDNPEVKVLNINLWEKTKNRKKEVKKFLIDNDIDIPVYVDAGNHFPEVLSFTGLPSRIYIDKNWNMRFKEFGFDGEERLIRDSQDIIEYLQTEK